MMPLQLIPRNLLRNPRRTTLTLASVAVSICLLTILLATHHYIYASPGGDNLRLVLFVEPRVKADMPLSHVARIAKLPGAAAVTPLDWFHAYYGSQDNIVPAYACDPEALFKIYTDWELPAQQREAFRKEKIAIVAGRRTAEKYRWKLGDHIVLHSVDYRLSLELVLRGIYSSSSDETTLVFHWDYLNDVQGRPNRPGAIWVLARNETDVPALIKDIDALFRNSEVETRTQTMKQFMLNFLALLGNVKLILMGVSAAVVFAILLIVANTMAMSIRERTIDLAVLRALGFRTSQIVGLLAAESLALSLSGGAVGCLVARLILRWVAGYPIGGYMPVNIPLDAVTLIQVLGVAITVSLFSTLLPAYRSASANVAESLRFVG
jgi:putative ABC transport system permease protein